MHGPYLYLCIYIWHLIIPGAGGTHHYFSVFFNVLLSYQRNANNNKDESAFHSTNPVGTGLEEINVYKGQLYILLPAS